MTLDDTDVDDLSLVLVESIRALAEARGVALRLGADVRGLDARIDARQSLHRRVLGGAA